MDVFLVEEKLEGIMNQIEKDALLKSLAKAESIDFDFSSFIKDFKEHFGSSSKISRVKKENGFLDESMNALSIPELGASIVTTIFYQKFFAGFWIYSIIFMPIFMATSRFSKMAILNQKIKKDKKVIFIHLMTNKEMEDFVTKYDFLLYGIVVELAKGSFDFSRLSFRRKYLQRDLQILTNRWLEGGNIHVLKSNLTWIICYYHLESEILKNMRNNSNPKYLHKMYINFVNKKAKPGLEVLQYI